MANRVVHFEIEAKDSKKISDFYHKAFGWKMDQQGKEYGGYIVVGTGPAMPDNDPKNMGINGGIYPAEGKKKVNAFRCVIGVENIKKAMKDVKKASGKVFGNEPMDIPKVGLFISCEDPEGNQFTLLQPSPSMMPKS